MDRFVLKRFVLVPAITLISLLLAAPAMSASAAISPARRTTTTIGVSTTTTLATTTTTDPSNMPPLSDSEVNEVRMNQYQNLATYRKSLDLKPTGLSPCLNKSAQDWALQMTDPAVGIKHSDIYAQIQKFCGSDFKLADENIGNLWWCSQGMTACSDFIFTQFKNAQVTNDRMINPAWNVSGFGASRTKDGHILIVQQFAKCGKCWGSWTHVTYARAYHKANKKLMANMRRRNRFRVK